MLLHSVNGKCCRAMLTTVRGERSRETENEQEKQAGKNVEEHGAGTPLSGLHQLRSAGRRQRHNRSVLLIIFLQDSPSSGCLLPFAVAAFWGQRSGRDFPTSLCRL